MHIKFSSPTMAYLLSETTTLSVTSSSSIRDFAIVFKRPCSCVCECKCACSPDNAYQLNQLRFLDFGEWRYFREVINHFYQEMKSTPFKGKSYFILSNYSVLALYSPAKLGDENDCTDDQPVMSIGCYSQDKHGLRIIHDKEEITFDKTEVKKIIEFLPAINKLLSEKLFSNNSMFLTDQEDVAFAQEYIQWLHNDNKDFDITLSASVEKLIPDPDKKRGNKRKLEEDHQQHFKWGSIDSFGWRKVIQYDGLQKKVL